MTLDRKTILAIVAIVAVGFGIGAWLALATRSAPTAPAPLAVVTSGPIVVAPVAQATRAPATVAPATVAPATVAPATAPAAPTPAPATAAPAPVAPAAHRTAARGVVQGVWHIEESNAYVGTILWAGTAVRSGGTMQLDAHKQSVGGRPAVPCERRTILHAALAIGAGGQRVPYSETNCSGIVSNGTMEITAFADDGSSFAGSFWQDGAKLGDFHALRL